MFASEKLKMIRRINPIRGMEKSTEYAKYAHAPSGLNSGGTLKASYSLKWLAIGGSFRV
jgi:hypothetical protein